MFFKQPVPPLLRLLDVTSLLNILSVLVVVGQEDCSNSKAYYTPSKEQQVFSAFPLHPVDMFDGPKSFSGAATTSTTKPLTEDEIKYYNYFTAAMYCTYTLPTLSCCYCSNFNSTVTYHKILENNACGTKALITLHPNKSEVVLTFRGSITLTNWLHDVFLLQATRFPDIRIHRGIFLQTMSLYNEIIKEIGTLLNANPTYRLVATGHSLGGAMASIFTYLIHSLDQFPKTTTVLVSFGQPRIGNKGYVDYMNGLSIQMARVVARADIFVHAVPVSAFGIFSMLDIYYVHHGQEVWINGKITKFCSKSVYEDFSCSNSMGPGYTAFDHAQYFDTDITTCIATDNYAADVFTMPGVTPTNYIPPMPTKMKDFAGSSVQGGYQGFLPAF